MDKVLITGIAGFIGSHLAGELIKQGNHVFGIDNLSTGREENLSDLPKVEFIKGDINDAGLLEKLVRKCDVMYHLAAGVGVKLVVEKPVGSIESSIVGTINVLRLADKYKKKVFLASSSEVYGKLEKKNLKETDNLTLGPPYINRWGYGCTKLLGEYLGLGYYKKNGLPVIIGRFFNVCGPRQTGMYGMVMPRFIISALRGEPITVYGDGNQVRSFTYITDAVSAAIKLMGKENALGEVFNIGNPKYIKISQLAELVKKVTNSNSPVIYKSYEEIYGKDFEDMHYRVPDIKKIKKIIGFEPSVKLEEMIEQIAAYQSRLNAVRGV